MADADADWKLSLILFSFGIGAPLHVVPESTKATRTDTEFDI